MARAHVVLVVVVLAAAAALLSNAQSPFPDAYDYPSSLSLYLDAHRYPCPSCDDVNLCVDDEDKVVWWSNEQHTGAPSFAFTQRERARRPQLTTYQSNGPRGPDGRVLVFDGVDDVLVGREFAAEKRIEFVMNVGRAEFDAVFHQRRRDLAAALGLECHHYIRTESISDYGSPRHNGQTRWKFYIVDADNRDDCAAIGRLTDALFFSDDVRFTNFEVTDFRFEVVAPAPLLAERPGKKITLLAVAMRVEPGNTFYQRLFSSWDGQLDDVQPPAWQWSGLRDSDSGLEFAFPFTVHELHVDSSLLANLQIGRQAPLPSLFNADAGIDELRYAKFELSALLLFQDELTRDQVYDAEQNLRARWALNMGPPTNWRNGLASWLDAYYEIDVRTNTDIFDKRRIVEWRNRGAVDTAATQYTDYRKPWFWRNSMDLPVADTNPLGGLPGAEFDGAYHFLTLGTVRPQRRGFDCYMLINKPDQGLDYRQTMLSSWDGQTDVTPSPDDNVDDDVVAPPNWEMHGKRQEFGGRFEEILTTTVLHRGGKRIPNDVNFVIDNVLIGAATNLANFADYRLGEVLIYDRKLSVEEERATILWMLEKWVAFSVYNLNTNEQWTRHEFVFGRRK